MKIRALACLSAIWLLGGILPANAATVSVSISSFLYAPGVQQVAPGDTVTWTNLDPQSHTVTSSGGLFNSPSLSQGATFSTTFPSAGTFPYFCSFHPSMTGEIRVAGAGTPPTTPPVELRARPGSAVGSINLTWSPPNGTGSSPITGYQICRRTNATTSKCFLTVSSPFTDNDRSLLATYHYKVAAINSAGQGPWSTESCSKPFPWLAELGCL